MPWLRELTKLDKWYEAEIILGKNSSTGDPEDEITDVSDYEPSLEEAQWVISQFVGKRGVGRRRRFLAQ